MALQPDPRPHPYVYNRTQRGSAGKVPGRAGSQPPAPGGHGKVPMDPGVGRAVRSIAGKGAMAEGVSVRAIVRVGGANRADVVELRRGGVYVDAAIWDWQGLKWAHLLADDTDDLHRFAATLGIHRVSYHGPPRTSVPHYDLTANERQRALALGAVACSRDEIVAIVRRIRG